MEDRNNTLNGLLLVALFIGCVLSGLGGAWGFATTYGVITGIFMFPVTCLSAFIAFFIGLEVLREEPSDEDSDERRDTRTAA